MAHELRDLIIKRHQERYSDFGPTFACEKLSEEGFRLSPNTLTRLLKDRHLWVRRRRRGRHRKRRERRACFGSMVQMDGSQHDWFEGWSNKCVLMVLIDDATNQTYARFYPSETTEAAFDAFGRWIKAYGLPRSVYVDRHSIYRDEDHPEKPTQFGRAMGELGVKLILAHSPQAKGRVERRNGVFQDRLVKEMRLRNIRDMRQANAFLEGWFLKDLNRRYAFKPRRQTDLHRPCEVDLELVLCVQEQRVVGHDWCVRWHNRWLQIEAEHASLNLPGRRVLIKQLAGGGLIVEYRGQRLNCRELPGRPAAKRVRKVVLNNVIWKPPADHPWKAGLAPRRAPHASSASAAPARSLHAETSMSG